jgi:hypothetical protein
MLTRIKSNLRTVVGVGSLISIFGAAAFIGIVSSSPVQAQCTTNPVTGKKFCLKDLDPTPSIPGSNEVSEQLWGQAGEIAYPAAAKTMTARNGSSQGLDEFQKRNLRPHFGNLVDRVVIIYSARMMDQWSAFGRSINLSGVDTAAQTYCNRIYVRDSYKLNDFQQLVLLSHEMMHSKQCEQVGGEGKFGFQYFKEYKRAGLNYENNKLEIEASSFENQFARSGLIENTVSLKLALDANNGSGNLYLYPNLDPINNNHLWTITPLSDGYFMITSKRNGYALDANGGTKNLYLHPNPDTKNPNHYWRLTQVGAFYMITSRVNGYALDANGGTRNLYLNPNPDRGNSNHLWKIVDVGSYKAIGSALKN